MAAGGIFILDTDTGPEDKLLNGGEHMMPTQRELRRKLGLERFVGSVEPMKSAWILLIIIFVVIIAMITINKLSAKADSNPKTYV